MITCWSDPILSKMNRMGHEKPDAIRRGRGPIPMVPSTTRSKEWPHSVLRLP